MGDFDNMAVYKRGKTIELTLTCLLYGLITWFLPLYELRRSRGLFSSSIQIGKLERIKFELTHSHQVFYFSLLSARLVIARILSWILIKVAKFPWSGIFKKGTKSTVKATKTLTNIPLVSSGRKVVKRRKKSKILKRQTRSSTRLAEAFEKVKDAEKEAFFKQLKLVSNAESSSEESSGNEEIKPKPLKYGLQKFFTLYLNRKLDRN